MKIQPARPGFLNPLILLGALFLFVLVSFGVVQSENILGFLFGGDDVKVDRAAPDWKEGYCKALLAQAPPPPFPYREKGDAKLTVIPPVYLRDSLGEKEYANAVSCHLPYGFNIEEAYASLGLPYGPDIKYVNDFRGEVDRRYSAVVALPVKNLPGGLKAKKQIPWQKQLPLSDEVAGRPGYGYEGFPLVFSRENKKLGLKEYFTADFGVDYWLGLTLADLAK